jgi:hypothetical protein
MHAYNLFRSKFLGELYCAVPEDRVVPDFVTADLWEFRGKVGEDASLPVGFNEQAATTGVRFNGFYLFEGY